MDPLPDNQPKTTVNPVSGELIRALIQCLIDWLQTEPSDEKPHRILQALAVESLKKADFDEPKRRFTAEEIAAAAGCATVSDYKKWLDWSGTVMNYWRARELHIIAFARQRGLAFYPVPERLSTKGGPGNHATYFIKAMSLPELEDIGQAEIVQQPIRVTGQDRVDYDIDLPGQVKPSWWVRWLFREGRIQLKSWHVWILLGWLCTMGLVTVAFSTVSWMGLTTPTPITTREMTLLLNIFVFPYFIWVTVLKPWVRLFDDRIIMAADLLVNFKEKPAQFELFREGDLRQFRLVRYSAPCPICGATIYLEDGAPDYPRRLVGRCYDSPREHVYSFDRVTRRGRLLIAQ